MSYKYFLYKEGVRLGKLFLDKNNLPHPMFFTYQEVDKLDQSLYPVRLLKRVADGPLVGTATGFYSSGYVFVNIPKTAEPVLKPQMRSWSWPGYKVDRTAIGVVAHELGHYVEHHLQQMGKINGVHGLMWRELLKTYKKKVSGYEPVPAEAWAETMRLFILNPHLLREALPERYRFICNHVGLKISEHRHWIEVLNNPHYERAAKNWIAA